jgi:hypothetical protein
MRTIAVNSIGMKDRGITTHLQKTAKRGDS